MLSLYTHLVSGQAVKKETITSTATQSVPYF